jgi:hypothetical protein
MGAVVTRNVPPYAKTFGNPERVPGVDSVGMSRQGLVETEIGQLAELYTSRRDFIASWPASASLEPRFSGGGYTPTPMATLRRRLQQTVSKRYPLLLRRSLVA